MLCTKCKQEIITEQVFETVIEKVKKKTDKTEKEKTKRQPGAYNLFLSQYMRKRRC